MTAQLADIPAHLPHRYPFLLVDRILEREPGVRVVAEKLVTLAKRAVVPDDVEHRLLLLVDRHRLLDYLSGLAAFDQKPSPGLVTHYLCQCAALQRGFSAYDFLVGDKRHKENLSTHTQTLTWTRLHRPSVKSRIVAALTQLKRRIRPLPSGGSTVSSNTSETLSAEPE